MAICTCYKASTCDDLYQKICLKKLLWYSWYCQVIHLTLVRQSVPWDRSKPFSGLGRGLDGSLISCERIKCKPIFPCKLWKLQSELLNQHPRGIGDWVILQFGPALGLGNHTFVNLSSHLSAPLPLDVDLRVQIEVFKVCTERLVCTWYVPVLYIATVLSEVNSQQTLKEKLRCMCCCWSKYHIHIQMTSHSCEMDWFCTAVPLYSSRTICDGTAKLKL